MYLILALLLLYSANSFRVKEFQQTVSRRTTSLKAGNAAVTIGTRGSPLALAQAHETKKLLEKHFPELAVEGAIEIQKIMTKVWFVGESILCIDFVAG